MPQLDRDRFAITVQRRSESIPFVIIFEFAGLALKARLAARGTALPGYLECEFDEYLKCGRLEYGLIPGILPSTPSGSSSSAAG